MRELIQGFIFEISRADCEDENLGQEIFEYACEGDLKALRRLLPRQLPLDGPLLAAVNSRHRASEYPGRETALHAASRLNKLQLVEFLVEAGAEKHLAIDNGNEGDGDNDFLGTPVHLACAYGSFEVLKYFIDQCGVDVGLECKLDLLRATDFIGHRWPKPSTTPVNLLHWAILSSLDRAHMCVEYLLHKAAKAFLGNHSAHITALKLAAECENWAALTLMNCYALCEKFCSLPRYSQPKAIAFGIPTWWSAESFGELLDKDPRHHDVS